jgi:hypothetical protein
MGQAGFELVAERFPIDATARSFDAAYRWVLDESPRRGKRRPLRTEPGPFATPPTATAAEPHSGKAAAAGAGADVRSSPVTP